MHEKYMNFLKDNYPTIYESYTYSLNYITRGEFINSIKESVNISNKIVDEICKIEHYENIINQNSNEKIKFLLNSQIITKEIYDIVKYFNDFIDFKIYKGLYEKQNKAKEFNDSLVFIITWFYDNYRTHTSLERKIKDISDNPINTPDFNKHLNNDSSSELLKELSKLRDSSREAVESNDTLDNFKKYMHIDRSIQNDLIKELERVKNEQSNHLIILCGSVGDGKSHLLAYLKTNKPELYNKFTIHNDATESFDPNKSSIDTLAQVLQPFNNDNFETSNDKIILAINLGVLAKFLESQYCETEFTKLRDIIIDSNILEKTISNNICQDKVSFITFSDYNLFELNDNKDLNYTSSNYISALFKKITDNNNSNPFYIAYKKDKEQNLKNAIIINYEMFCDDEVQDIIINYLIKIFIKYKKIVSTRELLNFIYEIIVPPESIDLNDFGIRQFKYLLPNLLFNNLGQSTLLTFFNEIDPTNNRIESLDKLIVDFNINKDIVRVLNKYFTMNKMDTLLPYLNELNENKMKNDDKKELYNILIHFSIFYGKSELNDSFKDEAYLKFLEYLYYYNMQMHSSYKNLFKEIRESIFHWKDVYKKNYICVDGLNSFKVFKYMKLHNKYDNFDNKLSEDSSLGNRFKISIKIYFNVNSSENKTPLDIDYRLYEYIVKLNNGFKPNKSERDDLTLYNEFVDNLLKNDLNNNLIVKSLETDKIFEFEYDDELESFAFRCEE